VTRHANWSNYGAGYPGTLGVPNFVATAGPALGQPLTLLLDNSSGFAVPMLIFASPEPALLDTKAGGSLLTEPTIVLTSGVPPGGLQVNWNVPNKPSLIGAILRVQAVQVDPGATFGFSSAPLAGGPEATPEENTRAQERTSVRAVIRPPWGQVLNRARTGRAQFKTCPLPACPRHLN